MRRHIAHTLSLTLSCTLSLSFTGARSSAVQPTARTRNTRQPEAKQSLRQRTSFVFVCAARACACLFNTHPRAAAASVRNRSSCRALVSLVTLPFRFRFSPQFAASFALILSCVLARSATATGSDDNPSAANALS